jgi:predicted amidohydrolase
VGANLAKIRRAAERAAEDGAKLLLLPECCLTGADWPTGETTPTVEQAALALDDPPVGQVVDIARRTGVVIAFGLYERLGRRVRVTQAFAAPEGLVGAYRKVHEGARSSRQKELFPVFDLAFARAGVAICYDNMFPECARILALKGAELLLAPFTSLPLSWRAWRQQRLVALRARAQDNRVFVLSASHAQPHVAGKPSEWGYSGICCAIDPLGEVIGISTGRAGRPQRLTVALDESLRRTYFLADVPAIRSRRAADYAELTDGRVQARYLGGAPAFEPNYRRNRLVVREEGS